MPKAPRKPKDVDPDVQFRQAQQLAQQFVTERLLHEPGEVLADNVATYVQRLYDSGGHNSYLSWLLENGDLLKADDAATAVETDACEAGFLFGLAVGSLLGPNALRREASDDPALTSGGTRPQPGPTRSHRAAARRR